MSTKKSLKRPKKNGKNIWFILVAVLLMVGITAGIAAMARGGNGKLRKPVIKTEILE